jgi:lactoylglutathione lyase
MKKSLFIFLFSVLAVAATAQKVHASLNHIAIYVVDLEKSTAFYKDVIGIEQIPEPFHDGRHSWFRVGTHSQLHIISGAKKTMEYPKDMHLCFRVPSVQAFVVTLIRAGIPFEDWPGKQNAITTRVDGIKQIYFKDPDGYWIEINDDNYGEVKSQK